jgi:hypothetical protein
MVGVVLRFRGGRAGEHGNSSRRPTTGESKLHRGREACAAIQQCAIKTIFTSPIFLGKAGVDKLDGWSTSKKSENFSGWPKSRRC